MAAFGCFSGGDGPDVTGCPSLDGLIAHWKLDEGEGTVAHDCHSDYDCSFAGDPQWATGHVGGALVFDGADDYLDCGNDPAFNITEAITLEAWININTSGLDQEVTS